MSPEMVVDLSSLKPDGAADSGQACRWRPAGIGPFSPASSTTTCPTSYRGPVSPPVRHAIPATNQTRETASDTPSETATGPRDRQHDPPRYRTVLAAPASHGPRRRWPSLAGIDRRFRANFAYVDGREHDGTVLKLCRLRYGGSAHLWGFAIYRASHNDYEDSYLPTGTPLGTAEQALDCACSLYLDPITTSADAPTN